MRKYLPALFIWLLFEGVAVGLWQGLGNIFYLANFSYIGACLGVGLGLFIAEWRWARHFTELAVGLYMLVYLGLLSGENMQIEGFWYFLAIGAFSGPVIHYLVAKIAGPLVFGRGWCGYACWTAMMLDLLPYKTRQLPRRRWECLRWVLLAASAIFVAVVMAAFPQDAPQVMFAAFVIGNVAYYVLGVALAFVCKDNRAFCKYLCPVALLMKPVAQFALVRVHYDAERCIGCGRCQQVCPMDVDMRDNSRARLRGTECILCAECTRACPADALRI